MYLWSKMKGKIHPFSLLGAAAQDGERHGYSDVKTSSDLPEIIYIMSCHRDYSYGFVIKTDHIRLGAFHNPKDITDLEES